MTTSEFMVANKMGVQKGELSPFALRSYTEKSMTSTIRV